MFKELTHFCSYLFYCLIFPPKLLNKSEVTIIEVNNFKSSVVSIICLLWIIKGIYLTLEIVKVIQKSTTQCRGPRPLGKTTISVQADLPSQEAPLVSPLLCTPTQFYPMHHFHHIIILISSILSDSISGPQTTWPRHGMLISREQTILVLSTVKQFFSLCYPKSKRSLTKLNLSLFHLRNVPF